MAVLLSILSVIGKILLWILFIILGILGLVLLIVCIVLFDPFSYRLEAAKKEKNISARARVTWLFHLVRVKVWFEEKKLHYLAKVGWISVATSDPEPESEKQKKKREKKERKAAEKRRKKGETEGEVDYFEHGDLEIFKVDDEEEGVEDIFSETQKVLEGAEKVKELPAPREAKPEKKHSEEWQMLTTLTEEWKDRIRRADDEAYARKRRAEEKAEKQRLKEEKKAEKLRQKLEKEQEKERKRREKEQKKAERKTPEEMLDAFSEKLPEYLDKMWDILDAIMDAPDKIDEILDEKLGSFRKYKRLFDRYPRKKETLQAIFKLIGKVLKPLVPKQYEGDVVFGTGDPFNTARILGYWYAFSPRWFPKRNRHHHLDVEGVMEDKILDADLKLKGHFSFGSVLLWPILWGIFNRDIRRLLRFAWKMYKKNKKAAEAAGKE